MYQKNATLRNATGLHARPASAFLSTATKFESKLTIRRANGAPAKMDNAKSMVTLLTLALACGEEVTITGDGPDEVEAVDTLTALIESGFGEESV